MSAKFVPPTGSAPAPQQPEMADDEPSYSPPGQQAPADQFNYTPNGPGEYAEHEPGASAPPHRPQINAKHKLSVQQLRAAIARLRSRGKAAKSK